MSKHQRTRPYRLYPAYCFQSSPTYDAWVKLTAADVHALRSEPDFQGQSIYFYLNHPIRFVRVVGVVVAIDDINLKYSAITLDDGSGMTVELKIVRAGFAEQSIKKCCSNTTIGNVNVISHFGVFEITVDGHALNIGTVLKAKGTISEFRGVKQLELKRVQMILSTDEEAQAWAETAAFKTAVLSNPWRVTSAQHSEIKSKIKADRRQAKRYDKRLRDYEARRAEHEAAKAAHQTRKDARREVQRRKEEAMMNAGALI
ncbi:OB-fold nucleic acid binding domain-containing protein [Stagonosporopsis vannaccii]|nr:OB-fold nucleic acid binding domain-containing protein [Stagonosporopsis vannaccii]